MMNISQRLYGKFFMEIRLGNLSCKFSWRLHMNIMHGDYTWRSSLIYIMQKLFALGQSYSLYSSWRMPLRSS